MSAAKGTQPQYQTIWLHSGQPLEVQLRDPEGIATTGPTGRPCVEFTLTDGRIFRATPNQASQVRKTKLVPGDWLRILMAKSETPGPNYGKNLTTAERISAPQPQQSPQHQPAPAPPIPIRGAHQEKMTRLGEVLVHGLPPLYPDDPGPACNVYHQRGNDNGLAPKQPQNGNGHQNGNRHVSPNPTQASAWLMTSQGQATLAHYIQAIDLAVAVKKYAKAVELDIGPVAFEDIRAIAACSRIDAQKREGIR